MARWASITSSVRDNGFGASRGGKSIEGAVIHHGAGTDVLDYVANYNSRDSHPTYHIASSGRVTGIVNPDRRPFSTSHSVDSVAVTFEIDNSSYGGNWPISDKALDSLINVIVDHAKQGGYKRIAKNTPGRDQPGVFFVAWHSQYVSTACPGPYVLSKIDYIVSEAQRRLTGGKHAIDKEITVTRYHRENRTVRSIKKGERLYLIDTSNKKNNCVGPVGEYQFVAHVYGDGFAEGDVLELRYEWYDTKTKKTSYHYIHRVYADRHGMIRENAPFARHVAGGYAVYLSVYAGSANKKTGKVSVLDSDATHFNQS